MENDNIMRSLFGDKLEVFLQGHIHNLKFYFPNAFIELLQCSSLLTTLDE